MKIIRFLLNYCVFLSITQAILPTLLLAQDTLDTTRFGKIQIYKSDSDPKDVIMLISGMNGIDKETKGAIERFKNLDTWVAVIDLRSFLKNAGADEGDCYYFGGEFERLGQVIENQSGVQSFRQPIVAGVREGAALAYTVLGESSDRFKGGVAFNYLGTLPIKKPLCPNTPVEATLVSKGKYKISPVKDLPNPWLQIDEKRIRQSEFEAQFNKIFPAPPPEPKEDTPESVSDLPLVELPGHTNANDYFVLFLSGDGGWATIDKEVGDFLSESGINVVGFDSLRYFWKERTPDEAAKDLTRAINFYKKKWNIKKIVLAGFSLGADTLPIIITHLSKQVIASTTAVVLLNAGLYTDLEVNLTDWIVDADDDGIPILPEAEKIKLPIACVYGAEEEDSLCEKLATPNTTKYKLPGSHHFDGDYHKLAELVLEYVSHKYRITPPPTTPPPAAAPRKK